MNRKTQWTNQKWYNEVAFQGLVKGTTAIVKDLAIETETNEYQAFGVKHALSLDAKSRAKWKRVLKKTKGKSQRSNNASKQEPATSSRHGYG